MLLLGPPGAGKSDLLLRLIERSGWLLVADDQVLLAAADGALDASSPPALSSMIEVRGLGLVAGLETLPTAPLKLAVACVAAGAVQRLPHPRRWTCAAGSVPLLAIDPFPASAARKVELALMVLDGRLRCRAGALASA